MKLWSPILVVAAALPLAAENPQTELIVARIASAVAQNRANLKPYISSRRYCVYKSGEQKSDIIATINFAPGEGKTFTIEESSGGMAEKVVRKALEKEAELTRTPEISELTAANYDFALLGTELVNGRQAYILGIEPKRKSKDLLRGRVWVDTTDFFVRRIEGEPAKNPSFWIKRLNLTLTFQNVDGMWLQTGSEADAHVRFAGRYLMVARDEKIMSTTVVASAAAIPQAKARKRSRLNRAFIPAVSLAR